MNKLADLMERDHQQLAALEALDNGILFYLKIFPLIKSSYL
jgi:hypothetical protein